MEATMNQDIPQTPTPPRELRAGVGRDLLRLCEVDSTSGRERELLPLLQAMLAELGPGEVSVQEVPGGRVNLFARWGEPELLFSTHLDTVPPHLPARADAEAIWGRGACDAKGQIVAQFEAIRLLLAEGHRNLAWLGVSGEETDSAGAGVALALAHRLPKLRALINGEPTGNRLATGQRGIAHLRLCCTGKPAHSGTPEEGHSALWDLMDWLQALRQAPMAEDPELGPEVWNLGILKGGEATNVVSAHAQAELLARTVPGTRFLAEAEAARPETGLVELKLEEPWDRYPAIPGFEHAPMPFGSDAPALRALVPDRTVVLAGPGSIRVAHTAKEHLSFRDLAEGIDLLVRLGRHFLAAGGKASKRG
jgi:acetylornithine deacetylase